MIPRDDLEEVMKSEPQLRCSFQGDSWRFWIKEAVSAWVHPR